MIRLFETHRIRYTQELDGMWELNILDKKYSMHVPSCWEQHPELMSYRGRGIFTKRVYIKHSGYIRLEFKGVSHTADVYFDGIKLIHHYNAFTPFSTVTEAEEGWHEIRVDVDNSFSEHSALHIPNDYYTYGGITRPVSLEYIGNAYISRVRFEPQFENGCWYALTEVTVRNMSKNNFNIRLESSVEDAKAEKETYIEADCETKIRLKLRCDSVKAWMPENPNLYFLNTVLYVDNKAVDDLIERVGFRTVEVKGGYIYINGKRVYLKGFNRHEDYAVDGCAVSLQHMVQDMDLMQDMNANAVRTCHYPNDERFLDLCDERGIMVWEENHARGLKLSDMQNPNFERQCEDCIREMIENHCNHPSIVIWGILNECASETEEGRRMYKKQYEQIRNMDNTRPVTSATCRHFTDICLDLPDIVSFNMYSGWYKDCPIDERNDQEIDWIKKSGGDNKPIIVSELGAAAIYGYRDRSHCKWSEERQADLIRDNLEVYMRDIRITGVFIWQFADCRVTEEGEWFATRARCHNNKGIVDEYRRPKLAYDTVKDMYSKYGFVNEEIAE